MMPSFIPSRRSGLGLALVLSSLSLGSLPVRAQQPDDAGRGAALIASNGCGGCHAIPGIADADGNVGPPLAGIGRRLYIAGMLRNTPDNMMLWLLNPQKIVPGNVMPSVGLSGEDARAVAAYLTTLR